MSLLDAPITALHGVGAVRAAAYAKLGISQARDLLWHFPRSYENRGDIKTLAEATVGEKQALLLTVATKPTVARIKRGMSILKFRAFDATGTCEMTYFNQDFLKNSFEVGREYRFYGKLEKKSSRYSMSSPAHEEVNEKKPLPPLFPIYPSADGLTQKQIKAGIHEVLGAAARELTDHLPDDIRLANHLPALLTALRGIHSPETYAELISAKRRLIYDELFLFALAMRLSANRERQTGAPAFRENDLSPFLSLLPYRLTGAQSRAVADILADMAKDTPMNRILVGDVGCGKTVCAAAALYVAVKNGCQAAIMVPTEILARQHAADLAPLFDKLGIRVTLLLGALTEKQKRLAREAIAAHETDVVIGTQALISEGVEFASLGLVVIDEQHRFGVNQRAWLTEKGEHVHTLVMSATPIPRTLALTVYGGLDISKIDEIPPGRQKVDTFFVGESYRERLEVFIRKQVAEGGSVYIVCPAVEEADEEEGDLLLSELGESLPEQKTPLKSAVNYTKELSERHPDLRISFVHGKMKSADKDKVMTAFSRGEVDVLVSTTVIEVGVNVPNACLMIVENADRFGLSQLHQLRGRVGRGTRKSYCVLVSDTRGENAVKRLKTMCATNDGYEIAETDLKLRGPGDFLRANANMGIRQSGGTEFRIADLCDDGDMLLKAFNDAEKFLGEHALAEYPALSDKVKGLLAESESRIN
ncbi:MAG: ATP-dependent DNA helicase RecG [Clostridia bacterium]|nr:ATP-dependent DNA helicase RecG [Clostridia bacterium]